MNKKDDRQFTPLNISYPIQKYSNWLLIGGLAGVIIMTLGIIVTSKIHSDLMFSSFFGSPFFTVLGICLSIYAGSFVFRKIGLREGAKLKEYKDMLDHEITTVTDLWDISDISENLVTFIDGTCRVFLKCEKGYVISRGQLHEQQHFEHVEAFIRYLIQKGYYVNYYNWRDRNANTEPLSDLEHDLQFNDNDFLRSYGNSVIKLCRELEFECTDSEIEYFVIESRDQDLSSRIVESVKVATEFLQGSLYVNASLCEYNDIIDFIELLNKIKGINGTDLLDGNALKTEQRVVSLVKVIPKTGVLDNLTLEKDTIKEDENIEEDEYIQEFLQDLEDYEKGTNSKQGKNLIKEKQKSVLKKRRVAENTDNIIEDDSIPMALDDDDEDMPEAINDDDELLEDDDDELIEDDSDDELIDDDFDDELIDDDSDNEIIEDDSDDELIEDDDDYMSTFMKELEDYESSSSKGNIVKSIDTKSESNDVVKEDDYMDEFLKELEAYNNQK